MRLRRTKWFRSEVPFTERGGCSGDVVATLLVGVKREDLHKDNRWKKLPDERLEHGQAPRERIDRRNVADPSVVSDVRL